jgi:RNA recognition motif-containing protein
MSAENNIFIKNIPKEVTEKEFEDLFAKFGQVFSSKISYD